VICEIPPVLPERGYESTGAARLRPRYEDVTQDGRVQLTALAGATGAVWRAMEKTGKLDGFLAAGILPIMQRLVICAEPGPFSVHVPLEVSGTWRLAREAGGERLFVNMWVEARAPRGSTFGPAPAEDAERVLAGRVYVEHVVTRPFATAAERKVTRLSIPGFPELPEDEQPFATAEALVDGRSLTAAREIRFGMMHTDSNQHVNSLAYPRLLEEAVVERVGSPALLARAVELRYRKPFFAGDVARLGVALSSSQLSAGETLAVAAFAPAGAEKPSTTAAMRLS
jgi:hypothetical protein